MKQMTHHIKTCQIEICEVCSEVLDMVKLHAQFCCAEACPVTRCKEFR